MAGFGRSPLNGQDVLVFESETYGNVLVLDGVVQCTERDEFAYQEMIAHLPLASHPCPRRVLVVGGGDGGVVREVLKHDSVESVVLCDIDEAVIRVSKQYLPHMSGLLSDPRVTIHIGDGLHFLSSNLSSCTPGGTYDVIITDCSDPDGPAAALFERPYFALLAGSLSPGGHISIQAESVWLHLPSVRALLDTARPFFPVVEYAYATVPTYPSGQIGFIVASRDAARDLRHPGPRTGVGSARYYNAEVHSAAFVLPEFCRAFLEEGRDVRPRVRGALATPPASYSDECSPRGELGIGADGTAGEAVVARTAQCRSKCSCAGEVDVTFEACGCLGFCHFQPWLSPRSNGVGMRYALPMPFEKLVLSMNAMGEYHRVIIAAAGW